MSHCATSWVSKTHPGGNQPGRFECNYGGGRFVACGGTGTAGGVMWSDDGDTWTLGSTNITAYATRVRYLTSLWATCGYNSGGGNQGKFETSSDGKTFTDKSAFLAQAMNNNGMSYNGSRLIIVGDNNERFQYSDNPEAASPTFATTGLVKTPSSTFSCIANDGNNGASTVWIALTGGVSYVSTDNASSWSVGGSLTGLILARDIIYSGGLWIACGSGYIFTSADNGSTWTQRFLDGTKTIYRLHSSGACYVAVGFAGFSLQTTDPTDTWTPISIGSSNNYGGITDNGERWVATTATEIFTSPAIVHPASSPGGLTVSRPRLSISF